MKELDANDILRAKGANGLRRVIDASSTNALVPKRRFPMVSVSDIVVKNGEVEYLVDEILPRRGTVAIWGAPKTGKSFWMLDVAMHVALGREYRGRVVEQGTCIYLALEGQSGMRKRVLAFLKHHFGDKIPFIPFRLIMVPVTLTTDADTLIDEIRFELGADDVPKLVVVDTLARAILGDENSSKDMAAFIAAAGKIEQAFECCVAVVHHSGWNAEHSRGASSLPAAVDVEARITRTDDDTVIFNIENAKDGPDDIKIVSQLLKVDTGQITRHGVPISSMVVVPVDETTAAAQRRFKGDLGLAYDTLMEGLTEYGELVPYHTRVPKNSRTIQLSDWQALFEKRDGKNRKPDTRRTAFGRAADRLQKLKIAAIWRPYAWLLAQPGQSGHSGHSENVRPT